MTIDVKAWIQDRGYEKSAKLLGINVKLAKAVAVGLRPPSRIMENLAMAIDRIAELEARLKRKDLPPGRAPKISPNTPLPPRPKPVLRAGELQAEMDWVRGRT